MILLLAFFVAFCGAVFGIGIDTTWYAIDLFFGSHTLTEDRGQAVVIFSVVASQVGLFGFLGYVFLAEGH